MRPRLSRAFVHTFWDVFDRLGFWFALNLLCFLSLFTVALIPCALAAMIACQQNRIDGNEPEIKSFFLHFRHHFLSSLGLGLLYWFFFALCAANIYFYWTHFDGLGRAMAAGTAFAFLFGKGIFFFALPLVVLGHRPAAALRLGFFLTVKRFRFMAGVFAVGAATAAVGLVSVVLIPLLLFSIAAVFWTNCFDQVRRVEENMGERPLPNVTFKDLFFPFQAK